MSFEAASEYSQDKGCDLFGRANSDQCNDLFDQYLDFDTIDDPPVSQTSSQHVLTHMASPPKNNQTAGTPFSLSPRKSRHINLQQPSQEEEWPLTNKLTSQSQEPYTDPRFILSYNEETGRAAISDSDLLSLDGIDLQSPKIASSPTPEGPSAQKKNRFFDSITKTVRKAIKGSASESNLRSPIRRKASSKMMRASQYSHGHPEWAQRMTLDSAKFNDQKFDFNFPNHNGPLSPPPSARVSDASDCSNQMLTMQEQHSHHGFQYEPPMPQFAARNGEYHTPLSTPNLSHDDDSRRASVHHQQSIDGLVYPATPHTGATSSSPWAHTPNTSEFDGFRHTQQHPFVSDAESSPVWWSTSSSAPMAQPSPSVYHNNPHQSNKTLAMQLQSELAYNASELACSPSSMPQGLMIQMPHSPIQASYVVDSPVQGQSYFSTSHTSHPPSFSTPDLDRQYQPQRLRKSRSAISSSGSPSPRSSVSTSFQVTKRRASSRKASDIAPRTPIAGSGMGGSVDFVNFTPSDSMKILTGVAPSGSSKTKARREKEAMEKRRRLSLAAVRAVRAAGGDVESLVEEGLFVGVGV